ncbi:MAG: hypothetical protein WCD76_00030 [Pyrinomonadaceae bacterium]
MDKTVHAFNTTFLFDRSSKIRACLRAKFKARLAENEAAHV